MSVPSPDPIELPIPLIESARADDLCELFDVILSGASLDEQDATGWTALSHACALGHYEIAVQLLDSGADPNVHESFDMIETPLSLAAGEGHFDLVRLLIAHGADPKRYVGLVAVRAEWYARRRGHHDISQFLLAHEDGRTHP